MLKILRFVPKTKLTSTVAVISAFRLTAMAFSSVKMMILVLQIKRVNIVAMDYVKIQNVQCGSISAPLEKIAQQELLHTAVMEYVYMKHVTQDLIAILTKNVKQRIQTIFSVGIMSAFQTGCNI